MTPLACLLSKFHHETTAQIQPAPLTLNPIRRSVSPLSHNCKQNMRSSRISNLYTLSKLPSRPPPPIQAIKRHYTQPSQPSSPKGVLHNKKTIITGASRGIGRSIAQRFAAEGSSLILVSRNASLLNTLSTSLPGADHEIIAGDVSSEEFWTANFKGRKDVDILVNAAGVTHASPFLRMGWERMEGVVRTNLLGTMFGCGVVGRGMLGRRNGEFISSSWGLGERRLIEIRLYC
jgi:hypothetical protein